MVIDTAKLKISTKGLLSAFVAFGGFMQIPAVHDYVLKQTEHHPHMAALVTAIAGIYALLHNPQVQQALGYAQESEK